MPLADDVAILRRPVGFAVDINRQSTIDVAAQRERLPGLLRFVRTFAGELLDKEFETPIAGYPASARKKTNDLRVRLRNEGKNSVPARALLSALIDLMDLEMEHQEAYPEDDPDEQEEFHDAILTFMQRLLDRFATWTNHMGHLPEVAKEAERGKQEFAAAAERLAR